MTTTVTIETCSWPVEAVIVDDYSSTQTTSGTVQRVHSLVETTEKIPPFTKRQFHLSSTRSLRLAELPIEPVDAEFVDAGEPA